MKRLLIAGLAGGIILFVWEAAAWLALPIHTPSLYSMAHEDTVIASMKTGMDRKGVYLFPAMPKTGQGDAALQAAASDAWTRKYQAGPTGMVIYDPAGSSPMMPLQMVIGLITNVLAAMLAAWLLSRSTAVNASYLSRVAFCGALGIFASLVSHVISWNWMNYPADYTTGLIADTVIGWVLAGLGIATVVKRRETD
jgi:hypothetical protein